MQETGRGRKGRDWWRWNFATKNTKNHNAGGNVRRAHRRAGDAHRSERLFVFLVANPVWIIEVGDPGYNEPGEWVTGGLG